MKKFLAMALALIMMLAMAIPAMAEGEVTKASEKNEIVTNQDDKGIVSELIGNSAEIDAWGLYDADGDGKAEETEDTSTDVFYVNIAWEKMEWVYTQGSYDAENMKDLGGHWNQDEKKITVTNQSNIGITATPSYADDGVEDTNLTFSRALTLEAATPAQGEEARGTAKVGTITVDIDASSAAITDHSKIGTITVTVEKVSD